MRAAATTDHTSSSDVVRRRERWIESGLALTVVLLVLAPLLFGRGFVLLGDMVFVPDQPWKAAWIGSDGGVPRSVPADAVVSVLSNVIGGELLQRLLLALPLAVGFLGMTRLLASLPLQARVAGALCFVWSPYVFERLAIGHWGLLIGCAALPWAVWATLRLRDGSYDRAGRVRARGVLVVALLAAAWSSPTGALLVFGAALVFAWGSARVVGNVVGFGVLVNLPWLLPSFLNGAEQLDADAFGVEAFAAAEDSPWGVWGSLFTFGGIWKVAIMPGVREQWFFAVVAMTVSVVALVGLWRGCGPGGAGQVLSRTPAFVLAGAGLVLAGAGSWEVTRGVVEWFVVNVPGGGLLRDGQKWVAWWLLPASVGFGCAVAGVTAALSRRIGAGAGGGDASSWQVGLCLAMLPVLALPTLALGLGGLVRPTQYPEDWSAVRAEMDRREVGREQVVALPFSTYRQFDWNARAVLDPASRFLPGAFVLEDALTVDAGTVGGESPWAAQIRSASTPDEMARVLTAVGVRWVLVHLSSTEAVVPSGAVLVLDTEQLDLWELPTASATTVHEDGWRGPVYGTVNLSVLLASSVVMIRGLTSRNSSQPRD